MSYTTDVLRGSRFIGQYKSINQLTSLSLSRLMQNQYGFPFISFPTRGGYAETKKNSDALLASVIAKLCHCNYLVKITIFCVFEKSMTDRQMN